MKKATTFVAPSGTLPCRDCHIMPNGKRLEGDDSLSYSLVCPRCGHTTDLHEAPRDAIDEWNRFQIRSERN